jgi:hypothetical protein
MARFSISGRTTIAGTSALPNVSLYATAAVRARIVEIGLWNTTATAVTVAINRLTTTGTVGAGLTEDCDSMPEQAAVATGFAGHTVGPTVSTEKKRATLGAAIGSGVIWTWDPADPLVIAAATTNGIGVLVPTGTGQILDYSISWLE